MAAMVLDLSSAHTSVAPDKASPTRQRITRACDHCHELRSRCNGQQPCPRCRELKIDCQYLRTPKKRGKVSRQRGSTSGSQQNGHTTTAQHSAADENGMEASSSMGGRSAQPELTDEMEDGHATQNNNGPSIRTGMSASEGLDQHHIYNGNDLAMMQMAQHKPSNGIMIGPSTGNTVGMPSILSHDAGQPDLTQQGFELPMQSPRQSEQSSAETFLRHGIINNGYTPWSPNFAEPFPDSLVATDIPLQYPVLAPLIPHLINVIPTSLAAQLLECYFKTFANGSVHPQSPHLHTFIFRQASFFHPTRPRKCSPALLCSMLWLAAQTSEASALTDSPSSRTRISQKLLELTVELLRPLRHRRDDPGAHDEPSIGQQAGNPLWAASENTFSMSSSIDHVITYIHLATVCSASEHKGLSIRWWSVAWAMARDMKLNREVSRTDETDMAMNTGDGTDQPFISEEEREERRRAWWVLFMLDRHLSLCYNRPLALLDTECASLCQPLDERSWQLAEETELEQMLANTDGRARGPPTECSDLGILGYFLPLMTILGGIIDLIRAKYHPHFGRFARTSSMWDEFADEIRLQLNKYQETLEDMCGVTHANETDGEALQRRIARAYGTHILHVLHILLTGKWDPVNLLDDDDHWVSTDLFVTSAEHATRAAEAISSIFDDDVDLSFMPFLFGIYLLQGSFLLLLVAEKLQDQTAPQVLQACENIVRAHEACVVTLDNEYQRKFRKIMISAILQVKGRRTEDRYLLHQRRREVLSLYRWTGEGGGLVL